MEQRLIEALHRWLEIVIPAGVLHETVIDAFVVGFKILLALAFYVIVRYAVLRALKLAMMPLLARAAHRDGGARLLTLEGLARRVISGTIFFFTAVTLLGQLGLNVSTILTGAGVAGLALSFGAQRVVRDVLTGIFFLTEDQFRLGETVTIVGSPGLPQITGKVLDMGLRCTQIHDSSGKLVTIGNGDIAIVLNHTRGIAATVELSVASDAPDDQVRAVVGALVLDPALFSGPAIAQTIGLEAASHSLRISAPAQLGRAPEAEPVLRHAVSQALARAGFAIL